MRAFRSELEESARGMGKIVRMAPDKLRPDRHVWVQFGDAEIELGRPCVCGSTHIVRLHRWWAHCNVCGRLLHTSEPPPRSEPMLALVADGPQAETSAGDPRHPENAPPRGSAAQGARRPARGRPLPARSDA